MRIFRSRTNLQKVLSWTFLLVLPLGMLGVFQLAFSHFAFAVDSNPGTPSSEINVDLVNGIAVRILDEAGQQQIDNINLDLTAVPGGSFVSGKFNVEVSTSNKTGYKLYMDSSYDQSSVMGTTSPDYTANLVNQVNTSYVIPTLANNVTLSEFQSGSNSSSNKWGYSLDDTTFSPIPVHATPDMVDSSSTPTASTLTPVTIGTNVNMDMASGVYKNQLTFSAVAEAIPINYTLSFDAASGENAPDPLTATTISGSAIFTIPDHMPSYYKYNSSTGVSSVMGFKGWSESSSSEAGSGSGPNGLYIPGDELTVTAEGWDAMSKTLYAVYETATFWNIAAMQQMNSSLCSSIYTPSNATAMTTPAVTIVDNEADYTNLVSADNQPYVAQRILYDIRDGNSYRVRKLADGNCWMTENLRLSLREGESVDVSLQSGGTQSWIPTTSSEIMYGQSTTRYIDVFSATTETSSKHTVWGSPDGTTPVNNDVTSRTIASATPHSYAVSGTTSTRDGEIQPLGNLYNYVAVSAGEIDGFTFGNPTRSICPAGWKLPSVYHGFESLLQQYNVNSATGSVSEEIYYGVMNIINVAPISLVFSHDYYFYNGSASGWTMSQWRSDNEGAAMQNDSLLARSSRYYYGALFPYGTDTKAFGYPLRCITQ